MGGGKSARRVASSCAQRFGFAGGPAAVIAGQSRSLSYAHVDAHSGDPWNEAVDVIAKLADKGGIVSASTKFRCLSYFALAIYVRWERPLLPHPEDISSLTLRIMCGRRSLSYLTLRIYVR